MSFTAPGGQTATSAFSVVVTPEDALAVYTGPTTFSSDPAAPPSRLSANLTDVDDGSRGDIRTAIVKFVNQATGARLCVSDVTGGPLQGTGSCNAAVASGVTVGMVVLGRYAGPVSAPDTTIVSGPKDRSFVTTRKVTFKLGSTVSGSSFTCSLDGKSLPCEASTRLKFKPGTHTFTAAARSPQGVVDLTPVTRVFASPFNDGQLKRATDAWKRVKDKGSYRGAWTETSLKGQVLTKKVKGVSEIVLVAHRGPGFGRVAVMLGGKVLKVVDLDRPKLKKKVVIRIAKLAKGKSGTVKIVTLDNKPVRIDGLGLLTKV